MASTARTTFELENNIQDESIYAADSDADKALVRSAPWRQNPHWFQRVRISAVALLRMAMHAQSGGSIEVMGVMTGKIRANEFVVMDTYPLPVEGTETRVNAMAEAYEYMVQYLTSLQEVGRSEHIVGWYHSHPGYGCWLSGIDVGTQAQNQQYQDPFLAIVVDPVRTVAAGKVEIGAFRTFPEGHDQSKDAAVKRNNAAADSVALAKLEDFGVHADRYYPLQVSYFKSASDAKLLDLLWDKYWASTLAQSKLLADQTYSTQRLSDLLSKMENISAKAPMSKTIIHPELRSDVTFNSEKMRDAARHSAAVGSELLAGLVSRKRREQIFSQHK